ncbi:MAG: hypothetical protein ACI8W8_003991, partial [Rhodothermales bacterium]
MAVDMRCIREAAVARGRYDRVERVWPREHH